MSTTHELEINVVRFLKDGTLKREPDVIIVFNNEADIWSVQAYNETLDMWIDVPLENLSPTDFEMLTERAQEYLYQLQNERGAL